MSWWGTFAGGTFGFMLGGPLGAALGAAIGRKFDRGLDGNLRQPNAPRNNLPRGHQQRVQAAFFTAAFSVMGHISKADGQVTRDEIQLATRIMEKMDLSPQQRIAAKALFNEGKEEGFDLHSILIQFRKEMGGRVTTLHRMFIEIICYAAYSDGTLHPAEHRLLRQICDTVGFSLRELDAILTSVAAELHHRREGHGRISLDDAYSVLDLAPDAEDAQVKKAYRRLLSQHHPDKLVAKGLPEEMMKIAAQRTHEIRQAYERIKEQRGF